jgi:hypothetical protein
MLLLSKSNGSELNVNLLLRKYNGSDLQPMLSVRVFKPGTVNPRLEVFNSSLFFQIQVLNVVELEL